MNNKGFIATSLIYSFFLIFITLFLTIIADYLQNKVLLNTIEKGIKEDINNSMGIQDFEVGDKLYFVENVNEFNGLYYICSITYKVDATGRDKLILVKIENVEEISEKICNNNSSELDITGKRLIIEKNINDYDDTINIKGIE